MKPDFTIPTMKEVATVRGSNGYKVASTFSGCGGSCLGLEMAGFEIVWANEFVEAARTTYHANHPNVLVDARDIRSVTGADILQTTDLSVGELDVLEGSPPCASFSTAGNREKDWGKVKTYSETDQRTDDLFFEYARLLLELQPKTFIAENVSGLVKGKAIGYFKNILTALTGAGYKVEARVLDASWLGVPQSRRRLIFIGVRNDLVQQYNVHPTYPQPFRFQYSLHDVLDLRTILTHDNETGHDITLDRYALGAAWDKITVGQTSDQYFSLSRPALNKPAPTITALSGNVGAASVTHPTQKRKFTLYELRRLSTFPEDFILTGTYQQRCERIGRSVPPFMTRAIGETIRDNILARLPAYPV